MPSSPPPPGASITYRQQFTRCGKADCARCAAGPGHGPYWYAFWRQDGRVRSRYLGKEAPAGAGGAMRGAAGPAGTPLADPAGAHVPEEQPAAPAPLPLPALRVRSLGHFEVWRGREPLPGATWRATRPATLFKLLLGAEGHRMHQERAAELLWPASAPERGAANLRATVHQLRRMLEPDGAGGSYLRGEGALRILDPAPGSDPDPDWWDAARFKRLATVALAQAEPGACREALDCYGGDYLAEEPYADWAMDRREELRGLRQRLLLHLAALCERAGDLAEAEERLRAALAEEPWHEEAGARLLGLLARQGRRAEGLRVHEALARAMAEELGVVPSAGTERLRARLETGAAERQEAVEPGLPTGTVTLLLGAIEGAATLWEGQPAAMAAAVARHDALVAAVLGRHGGHRVESRGQGEAVAAVFARPRAAVAAACALQQALRAEEWPGGLPLRLRIGLHSGEVGPREGDYRGTTAVRAARIRDLGHGGQVLLSQATADLVRDGLPEGVALRALGSHALKGLDRPEAICQLLHPALPAEFPPLRSPQAPRTNLPAALTSFIGREREAAAVRGLLANHRLVTLTGEGGSGKTRLALAVAADLVDEHLDGVWLVELAALTDPALVPAAAAQVLGLREEPGRPLPATLVEYLRERATLLLLDNCEHLVAACAALAAVLLRGCPTLHILATSREGLGVEGERRWRVPMLSLPEAGRQATLEQLAGCEAVRLLLERGRAGRQGLALTAQNAWAVERVCRRLDGLPLAIELAAGRLATLGVEQLAERLGDRFRLLTGGSRSALPHQQTLRATLDWSWDLLGEPERVLFRRLSVFAGGWTLEAAEAVCAGEGLAREDVPEALGALAHRSLVRVSEGSGEVRYALLETLRQYGEERLAEAGETDAPGDRHLAWYTALAESAAGLVGPDQGAWLDRLEREHDNLRAALGWARERRDAERGPRLAVALWRFWLIRGHLTEGRGWLEEAIARTEGGGALLARALGGASSLAIRQGDYTHAGALAERSLALCRESGDTAGIADALNRLGQVATDQADYRRATALHEESLILRRRLGDVRSTAVSLLNLGDLAITGADFPRAAALLEESLLLAERAGEQQNLAIALLNLGQLADARGAYGEAEMRYRQAGEKFRQLDDRWGGTATPFHLGETLHHRGEHARAEGLYRDCLAMAQAIDDRGYIAWALAGLSETAHALGDDERARTLADESLARFRRLQHPRGIARALGAQAHLACRRGDGPGATALARESLAVSRRIGDTVGVAWGLEGVGAAIAPDQAARAVRLLSAAASLRETLGAPLPPSMRPRLVGSLERARAALGEEGFAAAWDEGQALTVEETVALALAVEPAA